MTTRPRQPITGNRLQRLRVAQSLSREDLAARVSSRYGTRTSVHERTIRRWEKGSIPEKHWHELAEIFAVSVPHLLGMDAEGNGNGLRSAA